MAKKKSIDRDWIVAQFSHGIEAEHALHADALATAKSPPDPSLAVLYNQIAAEDERHAGVIETIATRYGYVAGSTSSGGVLSGTFGRLKEAMSEMGSTPQQRLEHDLAAKSSSIHWSTAWVFAFGQIGDKTSAEELTAILNEEKAHHDALQQGLNLLLANGALGKHS